MLLGSMTSESSVNALAEKTGGSNKQMYALIIAAIPLLIKFLTKNAKKDEGANSLLGALGQHKSSETAAKQKKPTKKTAPRSWPTSSAKTRARSSKNCPEIPAFPRSRSLKHWPTLHRPR